MCEKLKNHNVISDIDNICNYILSECKCDYCRLIDKKYNAMKIILKFMINVIRKRRKKKRNYHIKNCQLSKKNINNTCIDLIFHDIFKINIIKN